MVKFEGTSHKSPISQAKDIIANALFKGDFLMDVAKRAGIERLDMNKPESQELKDYVEKNALAITMGVLFDDEGEVKPWLQEALTFYGYEGGFETNKEKMVILEAGMFQVTQSALTENRRRQLKTDNLDSAELKRVNACTSQARVYVKTLLGGADDKRNIAARDVDFYGLRNTRVFSDTRLESLRRSSPDVPSAPMRDALLESNKVRIATIYPAILAKSKQVKTKPTLADILQKKILTDEISAILNSTARSEKAENKENAGEVESYCDRAFGLVAGMLFDSRGDIKPWVQDVFHLHGIPPEHLSAMKTNLLNEATTQLVNQTLDPITTEVATRISDHVNELMKPNGMVLLVKNEQMRSMLTEAPDPSSQALTDEILRQAEPEVQVAILKNIYERKLIDMKHDIETQSKKGSWKYKGRLTLTSISVDGKKYSAPRTLCDVHKMIVKGLDRGHDPIQLFKAVKAKIDKKDTDASLGKTREIYEKFKHTVTQTQAELNAEDALSPERNRIDFDSA